MVSFRDAADYASYEATLLSLRQRAIADLMKAGRAALPVPEGYRRFPPHSEARATFRGSETDLGEWIRKRLAKSLLEAWDRSGIPTGAPVGVCASIDMPTNGSSYVDWQNLVCHVILWPLNRE